MFYSQYLLSKKGPLGIIWIAAHLERKLRKKQITETDIGDSVDSILYSEVPIALRISSYLLLGVVKIYAKKVAYLFHDCSEALLQIAQAFQTSAINLSPKAVVAPYRAITLPESFDFDDLGAYIDPEDAARSGTWAEFEHHVSDRDLITLQEPTEVRGISQSLFTLDGGFSEGLNPYNIAGLATEDQISREIHAPLQDIPQGALAATPEEGIQARVVEEDILPPLPMEEDIDLEDVDDGRERNLDTEKVAELEKRPELDRALEGVEQIKAVEVEDAAVTRVSTMIGGEEVHVEVKQTMMHKEAPAATDMDIDHHAEKEAVAEEERHDIEEIPVAQAEKSPVREVLPPKSPTAAPEEDVLGVILGVKEPKPAAEIHPEPPKRRKRKRKPVFDNVTAITSLNMKRQLGSSSDLVRLRKKAPCTEYQIWMSQREDNVDQKLSGPSVLGMCLELKVRASFITNLKPQEPDKEHETSPEAVDDQMRDTTKPTEGRAYADSDVEEEANGRPVEEVETVKEMVEAEVVSTPPGSPKQQEVGVQQTIEIETVTSVKRRLEFEKPTEQAPEKDVEAQEGQPAERAPEKDVEAQQAQPTEQVLEKDAEAQQDQPTEQVMEKDVAMAAAAEAVPIVDITAGEEIQFVPNAAMELLGPEEAIEPVLRSDSPNEPQSQGLDFLADSNEPGNGAIVGNGPLSYSSYDTDSEHFGKLMEDKSGWASRTRAVALYLKEKFEAQGIDEQHRLSLHSLLKGRRRKEVARMFFEILVLRSKDFIQVEQHHGVSEILIQSTERLMKGSW
ncbi:hypothetical protein GOP47_0003822 [Adiantum capillus-veneris]|uniref:Uncharacterized protein n=1 Tax=Adiantum capillus-veneris TaxID=13818 RepID=A0A9D4V6E9_ADICA|nr:hypothetical protein GOP47_0003822 [Adiantum capillus-veneris]